MRNTPLQDVKKNFEGRKQLVSSLAEMVDKQHGDTNTDQVRSRLMSLSNRKLLKLHQAEQKVRERFGDRAKLIQHIIDTRLKAGFTADDRFRTSLEGFSKARLLDLTRMKLGERPKKRTPEQKLASKNGRKQKEHAKAARAKS